MNKFASRAIASGAIAAGFGLIGPVGVTEAHAQPGQNWYPGDFWDSSTGTDDPGSGADSSTGTDDSGSAVDSSTGTDDSGSGADSSTGTDDSGADSSGGDSGGGDVSGFTGFP